MKQLLGMMLVGWLSTFAVAQATLTVTPGNPLPGTTVVVTYSDPGRAGQKVTVEIDDGTRPSPIVQTIEIQLDANGNGSGNWVVADWWFANFNAPGAHEVTIVIDDGGGVARPVSSMDASTGCLAAAPARTRVSLLA